MKTLPDSIIRLIASGKFPFSLFNAAEPYDIDARLESLHRSVPSRLPEKRFFRH